MLMMEIKKPLFLAFIFLATNIRRAIEYFVWWTKEMLHFWYIFIQKIFYLDVKLILSASNFWYKKIIILHHLELCSFWLTYYISVISKIRQVYILPFINMTAICVRVNCSCLQSFHDVVILLHAVLKHTCIYSLLKLYSQNGRGSDSKL